MNLFYIQSTIREMSYVASFLENNFIGMTWPGTGDLEETSPEEWKERLRGHYKLEDTELAGVMKDLHAFVHTMQDGDYVIIKDEEWAYVGDLGDYYYDDSLGVEEDFICHRRGVTWLGRMPLEDLNDKVQALIHQTATLTQFEHPVSQAQLDRYVTGVNEPTEEAEGKNSTTYKVDKATIEASLHVMRQALDSEDINIRIRAAEAILQYARS
ncbi:hypothetical protein [Paenibacillus tundrae]|uniref:Mrr-cat superfamily restriction endonuclease n=1 Tax=Paenibacillus tundrae TaxID=528187 RepID=A0ABT9WDX4_9BACL|nr:hypothetical protein [Paenibacillus tundrae]MDQ0171478.1 putative Mrr-cat superfamily restriction endonuclease [Paenibacillus tundrae]